MALKLFILASEIDQVRAGRVVAPLACRGDHDHCGLHSYFVDFRCPPLGTEQLPSKCPLTTVP
jgi:hypothetical protein